MAGREGQEKNGQNSDGSEWLCVCGGGGGGEGRGSVEIGCPEL